MDDERIDAICERYFIARKADEMVPALESRIEFHDHKMRRTQTYLRLRWECISWLDAIGENSIDLHSPPC